MNIALVSSRGLENQYGELFSGVSRNLEEYISWCGLTPLFVGHQDKAELKNLLNLLQPRLIVLSGGESIGDNRLRDEFEIHLLDCAARIGVPVFGICRGMQVILHTFGCESKPLENHAGTRHIIGGDLKLSVGSYHHRGFTEVPDDFLVCAKAEDGTIEMVKHKSLPWTGVMWHPEREEKNLWMNLTGVTL